MCVCVCGGGGGALENHQKSLEYFQLNTAFPFVQEIGRP